MDRDPNPPKLVSAEFAQALTNCQIELYGYVCALLGGSREARDVLQEVNLALCRHSARYESDKPFLPWARAVAFYEVRTFRKRQMRDKLVFNDQLLQLLADQYGTQTADCDSQLQFLSECLDKLPRRQRELIALRYQPGVTVAQLAEQLGRQPTGLATELYRIRQTLMGCIQRAVAQEAGP